MAAGADARAPRILAGAPAGDRRAFPQPGSVARWFEPFHVRQPAVARGELASQVAAGADIVMAPAWLTHRRALETVGESRRAREWTVAAVRLAREAVETGLERREGAAETGLERREGAAETGLERREAVGLPVLVAGPLPDVASRPETAPGRLRPAAASAERDAYDQAGILADAEVDLVLVERRPTFEGARLATEMAADTGRPVWTAIPLTPGTGEPPLPERLSMLAESGATAVLVEPGTTDDARTTELLAAGAGAPGTPWLGVMGDVPPLAPTGDVLDAWLRAGARVLGIASGADPVALLPLAEARDRLVTAERAQQGAKRAWLAAWIRDAADRAPGGRALWLGPAEIEPPPGFDWTVVADTEASLATLPDGVFRLAVVLAGSEPVHVVRLIERGGIVALRLASALDPDLLGRLGTAGLRIQEVGTAPDGSTRLICRREQG